MRGKLGDDRRSCATPGQELSACVGTQFAQGGDTRGCWPASEVAADFRPGVRLVPAVHGVFGAPLCERFRGKGSAWRSTAAYAEYAVLQAMNASVAAGD